MNLDEFIKNNQVECTEHVISEADIPVMETMCNAKFGPQLKQYLLSYGYLAYGFIEFYGINRKQGFQSDMVAQTKYLHHYFPNTEGCIAFEDQGDGDYYLVDSNDMVYRFFSSEVAMEPQAMKLNDYILQRFQIV